MLFTRQLPNKASTALGKKIFKKYACYSIKIVQVKYKLLRKKYICYGEIYGKNYVLLGKFKATIKIVKGDWRVSDIQMDQINNEK